MRTSPSLPPALAASRRRARQIYFGVIALALAAVATTMAFVIGTGEAAHAALVTGTAAPAVPSGTLRPTPTRIWHTDDRAAGPEPLWVGTVVTWSQHRLAGRDATSGDVRWSYTRTDLSICDAAQRDGHAYVLFGADGDCDELSTFDAQTGARQWFRTLPDTGDGRLTFGSTGLVVTYSSSFHAIDLTFNPGVDRYPSVTPTSSACRFTAVHPGAGGVLASERCPDGTHLGLWDNDATDGQPRQRWRISVGDEVSAVTVTTSTALAWAPVTGTLSAYNTSTGAATTAPTLTPSTVGTAQAAQQSGDATLLSLGNYSYVINQNTLVLAAPTIGEATVNTDGQPRIAIPDRGSVRIVGLDGSAQTTCALPSSFPGPIASDSRRVTIAGAGLIVASPGVSYLR